MSVCRVALWFMRPVLVQLFFLALHKKTRPFDIEWYWLGRG